MYDPVSNTWSIVRVSPKSAIEEVEILEDSLSVQINKDQIYVFGGKNTNGYVRSDLVLFRIQGFS